MNFHHAHLISIHQRQTGAAGFPAGALRRKPPEFNEIVSTLVAQYREKERLLANHLCPADQRIQTFLYDYLQDVPVAKLPHRARSSLDRPGMARALSLPVDRDDFSSEIINSYRVKQGVLHNPKSDRRTTQGIFHVTEGGLPIPDDKIGVPKTVFAKMLGLALNPPRRTHAPAVHRHAAAAGGMFCLAAAPPARLPRSARVSRRKRRWKSAFSRRAISSAISILLKASSATAAIRICRKTMPALDAEHWTGHTGCVILAPHLSKVTKKAAGLPHWDQATERQRRDGMCWKDEWELYNNGRRVQAHLPRRRPASSSPSSRTTISAIAKRR